ncbi:50S ribosomal protein L24 [Buchnera aphidicola]|uniref:Large ribosomal subunit protein uL24 n=1 Tax=Buchnera aphidicola (Stegophylla sp.) TaxID=2315800 RepID=A0A4D6Y921_9GAMM|nr:50S ribosomal protein L24 [Buchnera aphidicola (Stegophylla sp.)]QCI26476.1 50S ribosomal protein L24 [Buchnera aphidicola (Stegophylla sp.)]
MALKIRNGDTVVIISGKDKNKIGKVKCILKKRNKIIVEGVNIIYKHQKSIPDQNQYGGIIKKESPIHISNVAIVNSKSNKPDRVGFKFITNKKVRFLKSDHQVIK